MNRPRYQVYAFWRNLENLPRFMKHLANVKEIDSAHSHWEAIIPGNLGRLKWNAIVVKEEPGFKDMIGQDSINRMDRPKKKKKKNRGRGREQGNRNPQGGQQQPRGQQPKGK